MVKHIVKTIFEEMVTQAVKAAAEEKEEEEDNKQSTKKSGPARLKV